MQKSLWESFEICSRIQFAYIKSLVYAWLQIDGLKG